MHGNEAAGVPMLICLNELLSAVLQVRRQRVSPVKELALNIV
jgi:hypothetical protein